MDTTRSIQGGSDNAPAQQSVRYSSWQDRSAPLWLAAAFFAAALAPGAQARDLAGASRSGDTSLRFAQAQTTNPAELQPGPEQGQPEAEILARELAATRQDVISLQRKAETLAQELAMAHARIYAFEAQARQASDQAAELKQTAEAAEGGVADLRTSLQQERERASRLEQDLATARRDVEKQTALAKAGEKAGQMKQAADSSVAQLQKSLKQERERAVHLEQELAAARRDVEAQTALAKAGEKAGQMKQAADSSVAQLQKSLKQERERAVHLEQELAAARRDVEAQTALAKAGEKAGQMKQAADSSVAQLQKSLKQERERAVHLEQELAAARRDVEAQTALAKAGEKAGQMKQAADSSVAQLQKSLKQERERAVHLEQELAAARRDVEAQTALAKAGEKAGQMKQAADSSVAQLQKSLKQERERAVHLEQELAAARRDVEAQTALAKAGEKAGQMKQATDSRAESLAQESAAGLEQDVAAARRDVQKQSASAAKARRQASRTKRTAGSSAVWLKSDSIWNFIFAPPRR